MHVPAAQVNPSAQSPSTVQLDLQPLDAVASHANGVQGFGSGSAQPPFPSQLPCFWKRLSAVQASAPHEVVAPFWNPVHLSRVAPSQLRLAQSSVLRLSQAAREPRGAPVAGVHLPSLPMRAQASHCPSQGVSQHTPSTQRPLAHSSSLVQVTPLRLRHVPATLLGAAAQALPSPQPATEQHTPSAQNPDAHSERSAHFSPSGCLPMQDPALQKLPVAQSSLVVQLVRHAVGPQS